MSKFDRYIQSVMLFTLY